VTHREPKPLPSKEKSTLNAENKKKKLGNKGGPSKSSLNSSEVAEQVKEGE